MSSSTLRMRRHLPDTTSSAAVPGIPQVVGKQRRRRRPAAPPSSIVDAALSLKSRFASAMTAVKLTLSSTDWSDVGTDAFNITTSLTDVVSDLCVAVEFYQRGKMLWFCLVVISIVLSSIVYTMTGLEVLPRVLALVCCPHPSEGRAWCGGVAHSWRHRWFSRFFECRKAYYEEHSSHGYRSFTIRAIAFFVVLPFAQLIPLTQVLLYRFEPSFARDLATTASGENHEWSINSQDGSRLSMSKPQLGGEMYQRMWSVDRIVRGGMDDATKAIRDVQRRLSSHMKVHSSMYVEMVVESIPQAVVQFLAVTMDDVAPSNTQLLSIALSMISIASKVNFIPAVTSYSLGTLKFRRLLCLHDVFNFFFIFSSLVAKREDKGYLLFPALLGGLDGARGSLLGKIWITKELVILATILTYLAGFFVFVVAEDVRSLGWAHTWKRMNVKKSDIPILALCATVFILGMPAVLLFIELFNMTALLVLMSMLEGSVGCVGSKGILLSHLEKSRDGVDWIDRLASHLKFKTYFASNNDKTTEERNTLLTSLVELAPARRRTLLDEATPIDWQLRFVTGGALRMARESFVFAYNASKRLIGTLHFVWRYQRQPNTVPILMIPICLFPAMLLSFSLVFGLVFPFAHALMFMAQWNLLQSICFGGVVVAMACMLGNVPLLLHNVRATCMVIACAVLSTQHQTAAAVLSSVNSFVAENVSVEKLLQRKVFNAVDVSLVPDDLVCRIGVLLPLSRINGITPNDLEGALM